MIYDARLGWSRFLEVDPIEGGSANDYDYVSGDPVNGLDLDGMCEKKKAGLNPWRRVRNLNCTAERNLEKLHDQVWEDINSVRHFFKTHRFERTRCVISLWGAARGSRLPVGKNVPAGAAYRQIGAGARCGGIDGGGSSPVPTA